MKTTFKHRVIALVSFLIAIPGLAWLIDPGFFSALGIWFLYCLFTFAFALLPAAIVSYFTSFKTFGLSWAGAWIGGWSGFFAWIVVFNLGYFHSVYDVGTFVFSFLAGFIGGAILGSQFQTFHSKTKPDSDLGYVLSSDSISLIHGIKTSP